MDCTESWFAWSLTALLVLYNSCLMLPNCTFGLLRVQPLDARCGTVQCIYIWSRRRGRLVCPKWSLVLGQCLVCTYFEKIERWREENGTLSVSQPVSYLRAHEEWIQRQRQERLLYLQLTLVGQAHLLTQLVVIKESQGLDATSGLTSVPLTFVTQCNLSERVFFHPHLWKSKTRPWGFI